MHKQKGKPVNGAEIVTIRRVPCVRFPLCSAKCNNNALIPPLTWEKCKFRLASRLCKAGLTPMHRRDPLSPVSIRGILRFQLLYLYFHWICKDRLKPQIKGGEPHDLPKEHSNGRYCSGLVHGQIPMASNGNLQDLLWLAYALGHAG